MVEIPAIYFENKITISGNTRYYFLKILYYFDKDLNATDKTKSFFDGIGVYENGLIELRVYNSF